MFLTKTFDALSSTEWATLFFTAVLSILVLRILLVRRKNVPPGPHGLPFFGYYPFLTSTPHMKLYNLSKMYGDVMCFNVNGTPVVHLGSYAAIRDAYVAQANEFAGRPTGFLFFTWFADSLGIAQSEGEGWKEHRRFLMRTLRDFGFGKVSMEGRVQLIAADFIRFMGESKERPINVEEMLEASSGNIICSLLCDRSFKPEDPTFQNITRSIRTFFTLLPGADAFFSNPLAKFLPLAWVPGAKQLIQAKETLHMVIKEIIQEHQNNFDPNYLRDYIDVYLDEMQKIEAAKISDTSSFTINRLKGVLLNIFVAGTQTVTATLCWALRIFMFHPEVQRKIQMEIEEVVGSDRLPSYTRDHHRMPYTEATINEVLRMSTIAPLSLLRSNPEEVKFRNYVIPKRSVIIPNLWAIHNDSKYWPEPEKFDPSRFLSADGKLRDKRDSFYPFSAGKRQCPGESLAKMEMFIFLTSILQKFTLEPPEGDTDFLSHDEYFLRKSIPFKLCAKKIVYPTTEDNS